MSSSLVSEPTPVPLLPADILGGDLPAVFCAASLPGGQGHAREEEPEAGRSHPRRLRLAVACCLDPRDAASSIAPLAACLSHHWHCLQDPKKCGGSYNELIGEFVHDR